MIQINTPHRRDKMARMSDKDAWACVILHEEGETFTEIGEKLGRHRTTVSRAVERYTEYGAPLPQPRNRKNTATTPDQDKDIIRYSTNHPFDYYINKKQPKK